ncbi:unnamed protein product [Acanthoscelides obtectus]|uniref:BTB domain-containing protein n=1 Tax=Acanthoscelides obtectus TaxID=200917 RepID=A0A9P0MI79_ACAOB|nr:unnamed protein product [Acanthoscelides obtectus]CAK1628315.1 Longitudinals lacking protein-like [Acanthoscelides obtectus]
MMPLLFQFYFVFLCVSFYLRRHLMLRIYVLIGHLRQKMEKAENWQSKYCVEFEQRPQRTTIGLCSLLEQQMFVDVAICCGERVLHVHKVVLAANSPLFKEELEKNSSVEHVVITGCDYTVVKSLVEFMYCGSTTIADEHLKYFVAAARTLQMKHWKI